MNTTTEDIKKRLKEAGLALDARLSDDQTSTLFAFIHQLERWNRTYNLTAVRGLDQMLVQHVFDSLAIVAPLRNAVAALISDGVSQDRVRVVDVGSGGGLPGVVLAVCFPQWDIYCVDAVEKKTAFIRQMTAVLALPHLHAIHARIQDLENLDATLIVSRAFASLYDFVTLSGKHLAQNGWFAAMKGRQPADEIVVLEAETNWRVDRIEPLQVPSLDAERCLVWVGRQGNT